MSAGDCPESWIKNIRLVDLWAKEQSYNTHDINFFKMPDGCLVCSLEKSKSIVIPCPDALGMVNLPDGRRVGMQEAIDEVYRALIRNHLDCRHLWDLAQVKSGARHQQQPSSCRSSKHAVGDLMSQGSLRGTPAKYLTGCSMIQERRGVANENLSVKG